MNDEAKTTAINTKLAMPGVHEYCADQGFQVGAISIVRFHDAHDHLPWFYRQVETVAYIGEICEGGRPVFEQDLLQWILKTYGKDTHALYI